MKYIDAEKLKDEIEGISLIPQTSADYNDGRDNMKMMFLDIIASLQQEQPIQINTLTWKDINELERIINNVHSEFRAGIGEKSFGEEVLERFMEERDEQSEVDFEKEFDDYTRNIFYCDVQYEPFTHLYNCARHFYELGLSQKGGQL